tara:strand:+ start:132 stop:437 length:306 start_codon:yes stop_codon:yes gene_type:complete
MIKERLKVLWFKAEDKAVEYSKLPLFEVLSKLIYTIALFIMCVIVFMVYGIIDLSSYIKQKTQRKTDVKELDEYSAQEGYTVPEKIEPGEMDQVDRIRKWM